MLESNIIKLINNMERLGLMFHQGCEAIVRKQFDQLREMAASLGVSPENFQLVPDLNQVAKHLKGPVFRSKKPVVFCDADGVINDPWDNNYNSNLKRLLALRRIVRHSDKFHLWSMRIPVDNDSLFWRYLLAYIFDNNSMTKFPFITNANLTRLYNFFQKAYQLRNPHDPLCPIELHPGTNKILSSKTDPFLEEAIKVLESGRSSVIIGSSVFDRNQVRQILTSSRNRDVNLAHLYYFDTGHLVL